MTILIKRPRSCAPKPLEPDKGGDGGGAAGNLRSPFFHGALPRALAPSPMNAVDFLEINFGAKLSHFSYFETG
jgi:hypothetical protein